MDVDNSFETIDTYVSECIEAKKVSSMEQGTKEGSREGDQTVFSIYKNAENEERESVDSNSMGCNKRYVTLLWAVLECLFFSGILFGWTWLTITMRRDLYFLDLCNVTIPTQGDAEKFSAIDYPDPLTNAEITGDHVNKATVKIRKCRRRTTTSMPEYVEYQEYHPPFNDTQYFCEAQEMKISLFYAIIFVMKNALILPLGFFYDKFGTTKTRLIIVLPLVSGTLMMTFTNASISWLLIPALIILSVVGLVLLLTNLQVANLFRDRRYCVMATLIGAYHSGSIILKCMKETHDMRVGIHTSFMFLTIAVVPILVSTIAFLPKSRIPWPLPVVFSKSSRMSKDGRRKTIFTGNKNREDMAAFLNVACSSLFIWSMVWYSIYSLRFFVYDGNLRYMLIKFGAQTDEVVEYEKISAWLQLLSLPVSPLFGLLIDCQKISSYCPPRIQQMHKILVFITLTFIVALLNNILPIIPSLHVQMVAFALQAIERVAVTLCVCAFLTHVHFPLEHFGKYISCHFFVASIISLLRFPSNHFLINSLAKDPFYINLILLLMLLVSCGHPINVWYHCRLGLIHDASASEYEGIGPSDSLVHEVSEPSPSTALTS